MTDRISTEQQKVDREKFSEGYELAFGGWTRMEYDPPGCPHEVRRFKSGLYWRPVEFDNSSKAGAIE